METPLTRDRNSVIQIGWNCIGKSLLSDAQSFRGILFFLGGGLCRRFPVIPVTPTPLVEDTVAKDTDDEAAKYGALVGPGSWPQQRTRSGGRTLS